MTKDGSHIYMMIYDHSNYIYMFVYVCVHVCVCVLGKGFFIKSDRNFNDVALIHIILYQNSSIGSLYFTSKKSDK